MYAMTPPRQNSVKQINDLKQLYHELSLDKTHMLIKTFGSPTERLGQSKE